jgi:hypothetical protein
MEEEYEYFRQLMVVKLKDQELDSESLDRMIEQVYWLGHFVGRCRERHYKGQISQL